MEASINNLEATVNALIGDLTILKSKIEEIDKNKLEERILAIEVEISEIRAGL
ncbi:hypothetical protein [Cytobacillus horneckiae]|uniref:hypothetical protein n=1 Tax=Cytobacillus horneckiae TaxID=549687 RepID=UPI0019D2739E|nr:hypothetical protein [Cytobacillus horneckiae]MBN6887461.1 hypothetical protein [Cytobacillus horneckiae]